MTTVQKLRTLQSELSEMFEQEIRNKENSVIEKHNILNELSNRINYARSQTFRRTRRMIQELWDIYPIVQFPDRRGYSICDIHLPTIEHFSGHDETMVSVALGYAGHLLLILSETLDINLLFPLRHSGSKLVVFCSRKNQEFPLYIDSFRGKNWVNFSYGVGLLNLNVVQLRTLHGLRTTEVEETLRNLHDLKVFLDSDCY